MAHMTRALSAKFALNRPVGHAGAGHAGLEESEQETDTRHVTHTHTPMLQRAAALWVQYLEMNQTQRVC